MHSCPSPCTCVLGLSLPMFAPATCHGLSRRSHASPNARLHALAAQPASALSSSSVQSVSLKAACRRTDSGVALMESGRRPQMPRSSSAASLNATLSRDPSRKVCLARSLRHAADWDAAMGACTRFVHQLLSPWTCTPRKVLRYGVLGPCALRPEPRDGAPRILLLHVWHN